MRSCEWSGWNTIESSQGSLSFAVKYLVDIRVWDFEEIFCYLNLNSKFLDASSHLYNRLCLSVGRSVRRSVGWLRVLFWTAEFDWKPIWQTSLYNSILVPYFRRIFVRTNLFSSFSYSYSPSPSSFAFSAAMSSLPKERLLISFWDSIYWIYFGYQGLNKLNPF